MTVRMTTMREMHQWLINLFNLIYNERGDTYDMRAVNTYLPQGLQLLKLFLFFLQHFIDEGLLPLAEPYCRMSWCVLRILLLPIICIM